MGIIFRTHATIHVSIDVNVTYLVEHCGVLQQQHPFGPSTTNHFMAVQRLLNQVCRDVNDLGNTGDPDRRKRQLFAALAVGFTSIFGIYGATQIHRSTRRSGDSTPVSSDATPSLFTRACN